MNSKNGSVRLVLVVIVILLIALIVLLMTMKRKAKSIPPVTETATPVTAITVHPTNTADVVLLPAMIEANVDATLSAEKAGRIVEILVDRGDRVEEGQLLLQIDDRIWQANLRQASIAEEDAGKNFQRIQTLMESGAISQSDFDNAEKARIQTASMAEEARINIEQCRVVSPVKGIINDRFVEPGEYVQPGTPLLQVIDKATVRVILQLPEKDIYAVRAGDPISFTVRPLPGRTFTGKVTFIAAQADGRNNAFRTEITVNNADARLRPGMIAQVEFPRGEKSNVVSLPMSAVLPSKGEHIVYLMKDGQAVRRKVQLESIARTHALVSGGLDDGDVVIIEGSRTLSDGEPVRILEPETATP